MGDSVPFTRVLAVLEEHGWELTRIWKPYRVFTKQGKLPILIPVEQGKVDIEYVRRIEEIIEADRGEGGEAEVD